MRLPQHLEKSIRPHHMKQCQRCLTVTLIAALASLITADADAQSSSRSYSAPARSYSQGSTTTTPQTQGSTTTTRPIQGSGNVQPGKMMSKPAQLQPSTETFESKFWRYLQSAKYRNWAPVAGTTGDAYPGQSPHGVMLKMYLNRTAAGMQKTLPMGSVVVKENYGPDGKTLMATTVMYKANGIRSDDGWYWIKYNPNGSVAVKGDMRLAGTVKGCIECHSGADGGDYAFFND